MRNTLILAGVLLSTSAFAQFTKSYAGWYHDLPTDTTVRTIQGPTSGTFLFKMPNTSKCYYLAGDPNVQCTWSPGWQLLHDNSWDYDDYRQITVFGNNSVEGYGFLEKQGWTEINTRNSDQAVFSRRYQWSIWTDEKVYLR